MSYYALKPREFAKIRAAAAARLRGALEQPTSTTEAPPPPVPFDPATVVAIGASTGGTEAIQQVLTRMPADGPGIVITQYIPAVFSLAVANRLNEICPIEVKEARDGDTLERGRALIASGNFHMLLRKSPGGGFRVTVQDGPRVCYQRPSVDVMFSSVAEASGSRAVGVLLTGMGADGAHGLSKMKQAGARTIAQDEATSVVYGMPREAVRLGAVDHVVPLSGVPTAILRCLGQIAHGAAERPRSPRLEFHQVPDDEWERRRSGVIE